MENTCGRETFPSGHERARTTRADTARITGAASPTGLTPHSRDETGPAGETIPLDSTVAHGVTDLGAKHLILPQSLFKRRGLMDLSLSP
ncbi:unnamed protein product [Boreogadus saida]